ncbi:MAG TPA: carboxypeptidase regulatory-like domain-containing protein, partial [Dongiaceae bacterium]|nr:carboxypeptidase regulatory-like domain-containing protein [Dongiaceae bacterium]
MSRIAKRRSTAFRNDGATATRHGSALTAFHQMALTLTLFCWMTQAGYGQDVRGATSNLKGTVFVGDPGSEAYVAKAQVLVSGPVMAITETDQDGKYRFDNIPPGIYTVEASFETLKGELSIKIEPDQLVELPIQLTMPEIKTSVTVSATESTSAS